MPKAALAGSAARHRQFAAPWRISILQSPGKAPILGLSPPDRPPLPFDPIIAATRFGTGLSPVLPAPASVAAMLAALAGPDLMARAHPIAGFAAARPSVADFRAANRARRAARDTDQAAAVEAEYDALRADAGALWLAQFGTSLARAVMAPDGLRERLVTFWADHFTVRARNSFGSHLVTSYVEDAIRPHVTGRFATMLRAVTTHPMMLAYLDQSESIGPNSQIGQRRDRGLNENLAREVMELHTLGVGGPYTQADVRELAELLTGLGWDPDTGQMTYRANQAEPGAETVLGQTFSDQARIETVDAALDALAAHPATASHIARKLAVHFIADDPDPALVAVLDAAFRHSGGDLLAVTSALLDAPQSWAAPARKVKPPTGFVISALRALDVPVATIIQTDLREARRRFINPLTVMGQPWEDPGGPDGWPEAAADWITPQFMAGRIQWAMNAPERLLPDLPDPRDFVLTALGPGAPDPVVFAAGAAEDRALGIGVILASAAFQRR